ncbi:DedA family protein [Halegenticoccus tardaugens]|uniref:DedA family protein n=1 Tax=Halegenticoccus tardaugens TaxID=2071624 RepID=UPI00100C2898|nr:VTT domain-containing protein [Halegenticoccus tardaugens]
MVTPVLQLQEMPAELQALLESEYAFLVLLGIFVLEGAMLMYVMPSELIVPGAIVLIGDTSSFLSPQNFAIISVAVVGATIGQYALFKVARRGGREYLLEKRWFRISEEKLDRFDGWFDRWGPIVVLLSNTMLFTRGMLTVPAGFSELSDRKFVAYSALGTLSFEVILAGLFVFLGRLL